MTWKRRKTPTISSPFKRVMGGGGPPVQRCRNASSAAVRHTPRATGPGGAAHATAIGPGRATLLGSCVSLMPAIASSGERGRTGLDGTHRAVVSLMCLCGAVACTFPLATTSTDINQQDPRVVRRGKGHRHVGPKSIIHCINENDMPIPQRRLTPRELRALARFLG
jgi:hypothetical protein